MKNFNIEQLQKKTPYRFPENTFVEMQEKVLDRTIRKEKLHPKIFKINYSMVASIAAALVLIFGISFLWKTNQAELPKSQTNISTNSRKLFFLLFQISLMICLNMIIYILKLLQCGHWPF